VVVSGGKAHSTDSMATAPSDDTLRRRHGKNTTKNTINNTNTR